MKPLKNEMEMSSCDDFLIFAFRLVYSLKVEMTSNFLFLENQKNSNGGWRKPRRNVFNFRYRKCAFVIV